LGSGDRLGFKRHGARAILFFLSADVRFDHRTGLGGHGVDVVSFHLTSDVIPVRDRTAVTREVFGREYMRFELDELGNVPLHVDLKMRALPELAMVQGAVHGARATRTRPLMSDGNDDVFMTINLTGTYQIVQRNHDVVLDPGDAQIAGCGMPSTYRRPSGTALGLRMPRSVLASRVDNLDDRLGVKLARANPALRLLQNYIHILDGGPAAPELARLAVSHVHDLVALSLGSSASSDIEAQRASVNAARLYAIKRYVTANLRDPSFSIGQVAAWQRLTPRQVQRLFERDGTTFSAFLVAARLRYAHDAFTDPTRTHHSISQIIYDSGFNDISNFNHAFRRRYGATPSDVRNLGILDIAHLAAT
jgi:AraC-like DNA-binding protein